MKSLIAFYNKQAGTAYGWQYREPVDARSDAISRGNMGDYLSATDQMPKAQGNSQLSVSQVMPKMPVGTGMQQMQPNLSPGASAATKPQAAPTISTASAGFKAGAAKDVFRTQILKQPAKPTTLGQGFMGAPPQQPGMPPKTALDKLAFGWDDIGKTVSGWGTAAANKFKDLTGNSWQQALHKAAPYAVPVGTGLLGAYVGHQLAGGGDKDNDSLMPWLGAAAGGLGGAWLGNKFVTPGVRQSLEGPPREPGTDAGSFQPVSSTQATYRKALEQPIEPVTHMACDQLTKVATIRVLVKRSAVTPLLLAAMRKD